MHTRFEQFGKICPAGKAYQRKVASFRHDDVGVNTATGGGFFFVSNDNGESWRPAMRSMPSRLITYSILQDVTDANIIYLGTNLGVYRSTDRGTSWAPVWAIEKKKPTGKT